jgi:SAM-dependent methyltransferase
MDNFDLYANYYDLIYNQKDYSSEVVYVNKLIKKFSERKIETVLDLGCGTGKHANLLSESGYEVDGVDISPKMIQLASKSFVSNDKLRFFEGDINSYSTGKKYDLVTSLFHVISYQNTNDELLATFNNAAIHLKENGLFIFDFWYGPGVLTEPPEVREKFLSNDKIEISRKATPVMHSDKNVVDVNYEVNIRGKDLCNIEQISETHSMRYFFMPELEYYLDSSGFEILGFYHWLTTNKPSFDSWNAVIIGKKK